MREPSLETLVSLIRLYKATATKPNTALRPQGARRIRYSIVSRIPPGQVVQAVLGGVVVVIVLRRQWRL